MYQTLAGSARVISLGLTLTPVESKPSVTSLPHGALQNSSLEPPLWGSRLI
ncbi:hypothetical protein HFC64_02650 [Saccharolobus solfataricus]|uniref:Uncharacterized protein n=1 Tax=Saccharolobus solfataricus TaxID=2287 RepID=A0A7S9IGY0_SACSO|nr:hypothetical protein [Saccharolobus solfataricus]QPG48967.1 hypothetical protein HFC64_02650 [Saccharolobus solfataricus]